MRAEYRELRVKQLTRSLGPFEAARKESRPHRGWLRAIREALGLTLEGTAVCARTTKQHIRKLEIAEADDRITLRSLRRVADAMDCELLYAIVPKVGTIAELSEKKLRNEAKKRVLAVEHSMALEDQAVGNTDELIENETRRITKKR